MANEPPDHTRECCQEFFADSTLLHLRKEKLALALKEVQKCHRGVARTRSVANPALKGTDLARPAPEVRQWLVRP